MLPHDPPKTFNPRLYQVFITDFFNHSSVNNTFENTCIL